MITADELKEKLAKIEEDNYAAGSETEVLETAMEMLRHIGSVDDELRDGLICATFHKWTINGVFTAEQMRRILDISLDGEHLFYRIGEKDTDSVFTRTFSVLLVPLALHLDGREKFLGEKDMRNIMEKVLGYLRLEKDVRGYAAGKGWAHSTAHAADALDDIAKSEYTGHDALLRILAAIREKICIGYAAYIHKEDDRMAAAAVSVFERALLTGSEAAEWIEGFAPDKTGNIQYDLHRTMNARNFLRSLYFKTQDNSELRGIADAALKALKKLK